MDDRLNEDLLTENRTFKRVQAALNSCNWIVTLIGSYWPNW